MFAQCCYEQVSYQAVTPSVQGSTTLNIAIHMTIWILQVSKFIGQNKHIVIQTEINTKWNMEREKGEKRASTCNVKSRYRVKV